jgi:hypothetical protein
MVEPVASLLHRLGMRLSSYCTIGLRRPLVRVTGNLSPDKAMDYQVALDRQHFCLV